MATLQLSDDHRSLIVFALRGAAVHWHSLARVGGPVHERLRQQARDATAIADQIDASTVVMLDAPGTVKKYRVTDTVTYERVWEAVEAGSEEEAIARVAAGEEGEPHDEEMKGATTFEAKRVFAHKPERCPSSHQNDGDDICADCGADCD